MAKLIAAVSGRGRGLASNKMDDGGRVLPWAAERESTKASAGSFDS